MTRCHPALQRVRHEAVPDPTLALEYTAGTAPRQVRQQDSEQLRQHRVDDRQRRRPTVGKVAIVAVPLLVGALGVGYGFTRNRDSTYRSGTLRCAGGVDDQRHCVNACTAIVLHQRRRFR